MKLSIITVNLNNITGLEKTIKSVLAQEYRALEYIIIDGGSTDGSVEVINKYSGHISYWLSERDSGIYQAMNKGIRAATGEYLLFLNSGDTLSSPNVLRALINAADTRAELIYGNVERMFKNGARDILKMPAALSLVHLVNATLSHQATLVKRALFEKYGFYDESLQIMADWAFFLKVIQAGASSQYVDINVAVYSMDGLSSRLTSRAIIRRERQAVLRQLMPGTYLQKDKKPFSVHFNSRLLTIVERLENSSLPHNKLLLSVVKGAVTRIKQLRYAKRSIFTERALKAYKAKHREACLKTPIIINNRNRLTYLKQLIHSLTERGYHNIYILDNDSSYLPLLEYYKETPYHVIFLKKNVGYRALWETEVFKQFSHDYYVYTDSDLELVEECPADFLVVMHYLLNQKRYKGIGKVGLSLLIHDLPDHFKGKAGVLAWEAKFWEQGVEKLAFSAPVDTTFALYRPKAYGTARIPALRMNFPYSARHLPWYERTQDLTEEQQYYYKHAEGPTHWSSQLSPEEKVKRRP